MPKVACVTGGNKGIGFETVKLLCEKLKPAEDWQVLLASRSPERGEKAVEMLKEQKLPISPVFAQLNIRDKKECEALRDHIKKEYGGLDMLVNNAAIAYRVQTTVPLLEQLRETLETNYFGTKQVTEILLPILRDNARVITVASSLAETGFKEMNESTRQRMLSPDLTTEELDQILRRIIEDAKNQEQRNGVSCYSLSKAAVVSWTRICGQLAKEGRLPGLHAKNVFFACCNPGWCKTDMAGWEKPPLSAADGAAAVVDLCLNGKEEAMGKYVDNGVVVNPYTG